MSLDNGLENSSNKFEIKEFSFLPKMIFERHEEYTYLRLVQDILSSGVLKDDRTGTGTLSKFGCQVTLLPDFCFTKPEKKKKIKKLVVLENSVCHALGDVLPGSCLML